MSLKSEAQKFVYVRTYARWMEEEKRRETWQDSVERYIDFLIEERGGTIPSKVIEKIRLVKNEIFQNAKRIIF